MSATELAALRRALRDGDVVGAATLLSSVPLALGIVNGQPLVALQRGERVLPVFLSMDSWEKFGAEAEVRLLKPDPVIQLLHASGVHGVLVDPALDTAVLVPATDFVGLLRGVFLDKDGDSRAIGAIRVVADVKLHQRIHDVVEGLKLQPACVWTGWRVAGVSTSPTLMFASDLTQDVVDRVLSELGRSSGVPRDLEAMVLTNPQTERARQEWTGLDVAVVGPPAQ